MFCLFVIAVSGCKPGGGGAIGSYSSPVEGGSNPNAQELIIDEKSIKIDQIKDKGCRIYWKTSVPATSCIEYGQSTNYDKTTVEDKNLVIDHYVELYGLQPHTRYYFKVVSSDAFKHLAQSIKEIYFDTYDQNLVPPAVTLNSPTNITSTSMSITWAQSYETDFYQYILYRDTTDAVSFMSPKISVITSKMLTAYEDTNLTPNTAYYYLLYVLDTAELASAPSNIVTGTTSVQYNTLAKINISEPSYKTTDSMVINWNKCNESDFASYRLYWSNKPGVDTLSTMEAEITNADTTSVEIKNLKENTSYYFKLYLKNKGKVFTASDEACFKTYKNGELIRSISGVYYGNDIKIANSKAYVSAYNALYIVDLSTNIVKSIDLEGQNDRIRKNASGDKLYIVNRSAKEITVFNTVSDSLERKMPAGNSPTDVAVSETTGYYYTTDYYDGYVNKYNLSSGSLEASTRIGTSLNSITLGTNNGDLFVARMPAYDTSEVKTLSSDLKVKANAFVGTDPVYLYMDNGGLNIYCANYQAQSVSRINSLTGALVDTFSVGTQPHSIVQTKNGKYTFIANFGSSNISMFINAQNFVLETIADGKMPRALELSASDRELYVIDYEAQALNVYAVRQ